MQPAGPKYSRLPLVSVSHRALCTVHSHFAQASASDLWETSEEVAEASGPAGFDGQGELVALFEADNEVLVAAVLDEVQPRSNLKSAPKNQSRQ